MYTVFVHWIDQPTATENRRITRHQREEPVPTNQKRRCRRPIGTRHKTRLLKPSETQVVLWTPPWVERQSEDGRSDAAETSLRTVWGPKKLQQYTGKNAKFQHCIFHTPKHQRNSVFLTSNIITQVQLKPEPDEVETAAPRNACSIMKSVSEFL